MLVSLNWLKQYVDLNGMDVQEYAQKMIRAGNAVEEIVGLGAEIDKVVVGKIERIEKHPNADVLSICQVNVGDEVIQIVTGAPNMSEGDFVPVALDGSTLPGGVKIKKGKLRGEVSMGMMCSGEELNVPKEVYPSNADRGLLILKGDLTPGQDIKPILGLDDTVIDFEILANRPDCLSILGMAYESAASTSRGMQLPEIKGKGSGGDVNEYVKISIEDEELCPRYCARVVKNIKIEPSPLWMRLRLHASGIKPINNIVDITNYVMVEMGQPMHAFDLDFVRGREIIVRKARQGEEIRTLDGKDRTLTDSMLVIADKEGATGLAGVMGGEGSEITDQTKLVLFESACFQGASIRQTGRAIGLRTESQGRFERGVNVHLVDRALERAVQLVEELGAGEVVDGVIDVYPVKKQIKEVKAEVSYLQTLMGIKVPAQEMKEILETLLIETRIEDGWLYCTPPKHRQDIVIAADIAEEVLRLYGYDKIPTTLMYGKTVGGKNSASLARNAQLRNLLLGFGAYEAVTFAFIAPKWYDMLSLPKDAPERHSARLQNPIGEDYSMMRTTLVPSILQVLSTNQSRSVDEYLCFEMAKRYLPKELPLNKELPEERDTLCLGLYGEDADFYRVKGMVEAILNRFKVEGVSWKRADKPYLHPGRSAYAVKDGLVLAVLGQVHPQVQQNFALSKESYVAEIDLMNLDACAQEVGQVGAAPRFPAVSRDMALVVQEEVLVGDMMQAIKEAGGKLLERVELFDIYRGSPVPAGSKSVALSLTLRSPDHTLEENEIGRCVEKVLRAMEDKFSAVLRS